MIATSFASYCVHRLMYTCKRNNFGFCTRFPVKGNEKNALQSAYLFQLLVDFLKCLAGMIIM